MDDLGAYRGLMNENLIWDIAHQCVGCGDYHAEEEQANDCCGDETHKSMLCKICLNPPEICECVKTVKVVDYKVLSSLMWDRKVDEIPLLEALYIYENRSGHFDVSDMDEKERNFLKNLITVFFGKGFYS